MEYVLGDSPAGIELRLVEERHAPAIFAAVDRDREYLRQWVAWVDATRTEEDILAFIRRSMEQFASNNGSPPPSGRVDVSPAWSRNAHPRRLAWLSRLKWAVMADAREFQGLGIATDAARAMTRPKRSSGAGAESHGDSLRRGPMPRSSAIPKRLGFTFEGTLREAQVLDGRYVDLEVYSMLRREYSLLRKAGTAMPVPPR